MYLHREKTLPLPEEVVYLPPRWGCSIWKAQSEDFLTSGAEDLLHHVLNAGLPDSVEALEDNEGGSAGCGGGRTGAHGK